MEQKYQVWIEEYVRRSEGRLRGFCLSASKQMAERFPELHVVRGFVVPAEPGKMDYGDQLPTPQMEVEDRKLAWDRECGVTQHFWCEDSNGIQYDPTAGQFRKGVGIVYIEYNPMLHGPAPLGKCPCCGDLVFPPSDGFCNNICRTSFRTHMGMG